MTQIIELEKNLKVVERIVLQTIKSKKRSVIHLVSDDPLRFFNLSSLLIQVQDYKLQGITIRPLQNRMTSIYEQCRNLISYQNEISELPENLAWGWRLTEFARQEDEIEYLNDYCTIEKFRYHENYRIEDFFDYVNEANKILSTEVFIADTQTVSDFSISKLESVVQNLPKLRFDCTLKELYNILQELTNRNLLTSSNSEIVEFIYSCCIIKDGKVQPKKDTLQKEYSRKNNSPMPGKRIRISIE